MEDILNSLPVKGRAPKTGYSRAEFGPTWSDVDANSCPTRDDILARDLGTKDMKGSCTVTSGSITDPYTGQTLTFTRGASVVDIDHVVALGNAWVTGAFAWDKPKRVAFANDPENLLAVSASANRSKGDGDAATWLPPLSTFRCEYVTRQLQVKATYGLWVTPAEKQAITQVLSSCPTSTTGPVSTTPSTPRAEKFTSCAQLRAAGLAPVQAPDPLYFLNSHLDRDRDGVACE